MASSTYLAYQAIADLNLWFKVRSGDDLTLADIPEIVPLRWPDFRDNWEFLKQGLIDKVADSANPDFLNDQIRSFSTFIESQRVSAKINPFSDSITTNKFYAVFDNILVESINLSNQEEQIVQSRIDRVTQFSKNDFLKIKNALIDHRDTIADTIGLGDADYDRAFGKSAIAPQVSATIVDLNMLVTVQASLRSVDFVLANLFAVDAAIDPFALARANANNPDINIGQYSSGRLVKINYGEDLQSLAARYLGDANKWIDIAIANGLKAPYIDEIGVKLQLLANGSGNQINLSQTDINGELNINRLFINQAIFLQSSVYVSPEQRTIINITEIPVSGEIIIELDGLADLSKYKTSEGASVRVYKPNTINSSFFVLIPSEESLPDGRREEVPWFLSKAAEDEKRAKVDLAIDANGELNFTSNGDLTLSYGLANAVQALKLKIVTELGSLRYHPGFGLVSILGNQNSDLESVKSLITESLTEQIELDSRFDRIENLTVDYLVNSATNEGVSAMSITLSVRLAGGSTVVPISFTVNQ
jgi:hypothetical protein